MPGQHPIDRLASLDACREAREHIRECGTLRVAWDECAERRWMTWLVACAHRRGSLTRMRLVEVVLRCASTVAHVRGAA